MKGQLISAPGWVLKQNSSPQKRKAAILHPQLMSISLCYHPTICHSTSYASCHNSCFGFSDMFLATCFSPPGVWQNYEAQKSPASFCFEAWKWSFASSFVSRCPFPTSSHQPSHKAQLAFLCFLACGDSELWLACRFHEKFTFGLQQGWLISKEAHQQPRTVPWWVKACCTIFPGWLI